MKITEYGITVVYLMILCRIAYADWKYQIIEPWTHIGILTLACMEMLFRVGVSVQERCLGAVVIGEFLAAKEGLGYLIIYSSQVFKMDWLLMSICLLCLFAMCLYALINQLESCYLKRNKR